MGLLVAAGGVPKIYAQDVDLTGNGRVSNLSLKANTQDVTTFADAGVRRKVGTKNFSFRFEGLFNAEPQQSHNILGYLYHNPGLVSVYPEGDGLGKSGIVLLSAFVERYEIGITVGEVVPVSADIVQEGDAEIVQSLGTRHEVAVTATASGPSLDNGAASYSGGIFVVHVFGVYAVGGNARWQAHLQHSSDDGATDPYSTIATITFTGWGGYHIEFEGTVKQFLRAQWVLDADSGGLLAHGAVRRN